MMHLHDALAEQAQLIARWESGYDHWAKDFTRYALQGGLSIVAADMAKAAQANLYLITAPIVTLLWAAQDTLPRDIPFRDLASPPLPAREGFVYLEDPLVAEDAQVGAIALQAFSFRQVDAVVQLCAYEHRTPGTVMFQGRRIDPGGLYPLSGFALPYEGSLSTLEAIELRASPESQAEPVYHSLLEQALRSFLTFQWSVFAFLGQEIVRQSKVQAGRQVQHSWQKQFGAKPAPITVVELRRVIHAHQDGTAIDVEWQHQWVVRGHWRKQWYPVSQVHRPLWIHPYVKGPDDKPLKPPSTPVFLVDR